MKKFFLLTGVCVVMNSQLTACSAVGPKGSQAMIGDQNNIVIWNPDTKTETFIRYASFSSEAKDLGFITPTPTTPKLAIVETGIYDLLASLEPKEGPQTNSADSFSPAAAKGGGTVDVLQVVNIGKYEATSLKASDAAALAGYLKKNGYEVTPGVQKWTEFYVKKNWVLTAFKIRKDASGRLEQGAVSMTFSTEKPFNPYYVPMENALEPGRLGLYFISSGEHVAKVGEEGQTWEKPKWETDVPTEKKTLIEAVTKMSLPANPYLAYYESRFPIADQDDLYFKPSSRRKAAGFALIAVFASLVATFAALFAVMAANKKKQTSDLPPLS
jgi:hypothetical protein